MSILSQKTENTIEAYIGAILKNSTSARPAWNVESAVTGKPPAWNYIDGVFITSLLSLYGQTRQNEFAAFAQGFTDNYIADDGAILGYTEDEYNIDHISFGRVLFDLYDLYKKEKYRKAIECLYAQLMNHPRTEKGSFWHKKIYPDQVWLDGLYMGQVFYTRYETAFNGCKRYDDIALQFENVRAYMFDEKKRLYYHGCDFSKKAFWADPVTGLSKSFWLRAMGWYVTGLADVIGYLAPEAVRLRSRLSALLREALDGIRLYIDPTAHMLFQVVDQAERAGNYLETSGSAMIAYAAMKAARLGVVPGDYFLEGAQIFVGICDRCLTERAGARHLSGICLAAGLGPQGNLKRDGTFAYYISEPVVEDDAKGLGPFLMAYTEIKNNPVSPVLGSVSNKK